jgi:PBP1b-binding outer membrane lipoprotein LpoB
MINWRNIAFYSVVLSAVLALAGCSSTTAEPESSSTAPAIPTPESKTELTPASAKHIKSRSFPAWRINGNSRG